MDLGSALALFELKTMKYIALILLIIAFNASAQTTYLKVADKPDYAKYQTWCKDSIWVDIVQYGKATIVNPQLPELDYQLYKAVYGNPATLKDTVWYQLWHRGIKTAAISLTSDQMLLVRKVRIKTQRYEPSVTHYYLIRDKYRIEWQNLKE